ncbi:tetratricopeptide repeat-containing sulfotransferase family protein [Microbulbifer agarilyticus]
MNNAFSAIALYRAGRLDDALRCCLSALRSASPPLAAFEIAAEIHLRRNQWDAAETLLNEAIRYAPDSLNSRFNLGVVHVQRKKLEAALAHFEHCLREAPDNVEYMNAVGNCLRLQGDCTQASRVLKGAHAKAPKHGGICENLGWVLLSSNPHEAHAHFEAAFSAGNRSARVAQGMTESLIATGAYQAAVNLAQSALKEFSKNPELHHCLGVALVKSRRSTTAIDAFRTALRFKPEHAEARVNLAVQLEQQGELGAAEQELREALIRQPMCPEALFHLAFLKSACFSEAEEQLLRCALREARNLNDKGRLGLALGRVLEQRKKHEESMQAVLSARKMLAPSSQYCPESDSRRTEELILSHTQQSTRNAQAQEAVSSIFVVGMPRSGTSLTEQILASHPQVEALGETGVARALLQKLTDLNGGQYPQNWAQISPQQRHDLRIYAQGLLTDRLPRQENKVLVETTPGNHALVGMLAELLPSARFVLCQRSPLDTAISLLQHPLSPEHDYSHRLEHLSHRFKQFARCQQLWLRQFPNSCTRVMYERLVTEPEQTIRALLATLELPYSETCLYPHKTQRTVRTPSAAQVRSPIYRSAVQRWKKYHGALSPLISSLEPLEDAHQADLRSTS